MSATTPPMPQSQEEWEAHWAFYKLTVAQRDAAWSEVRGLRQMIDRLGHLMHFVDEVYDETRYTPETRQIMDEHDQRRAAQDPPDAAHPERQDPLWSAP
jgi:hypothetical protein